MNRTTIIVKIALELRAQFPSVDADTIAETVDYTTSFLTDAELLGADWAELISDIKMDAAFA